MYLINCFMVTKYYINIQWLFTSDIVDIHACLKLLPLSLEIGQNIYISTNNVNKLQKFLFIYDNV